jgi:vitamin B12 transporter
MYLHQKFGFLAFFIVSLVSFGYETGYAQNSNLDTVVVTSSRTAESLKDVTSNISIIESTELENGSAETLQEILAQKSLTVTKNVGSLSTVSIRGFATDNHGLDLGSHVLVLLNGRRLGTGNASMISLANVDRIEIIRGSAAVQYGTAAMGGVVNVITKKGTDLPFGATVKASVGSFDTKKASLKFIGSYKNFDLSGGFSYSHNGDYKIGNGLPYNNSDGTNYAGGAEIGYSFLENHRVALSINYYDSPDTGSPGAFKENGVQNLNRTDKYNYSIGFDYTGQTYNERWSWYNRYSIGKDYRGYIYPVATRNAWNAVAAQTGQAQLNYKSELLEVTGGIDYLNYDISQSANSNTTPDSTYTNEALFSLVKFRLFEDSFILSLGARYDFFEFHDDKSGLVVHKYNFSPSIGFAYIPFDFLKIRAHYSDAFCHANINTAHG